MNWDHAASTKNNLVKEFGHSLNWDNTNFVTDFLKASFAKISLLQNLNTKDKSKFLLYHDKGFMYFPCEQLLTYISSTH